MRFVIDSFSDYFKNVPNIGPGKISNCQSHLYRLFELFFKSILIKVSPNITYWLYLNYQLWSVVDSFIDHFLLEPSIAIFNR